MAPVAFEKKRGPESITIKAKRCSLVVMRRFHCPTRLDSSCHVIENFLTIAPDIFVALILISHENKSRVQKSY